MERRNALGWRPALDGLRGIAVLSVVFYHFNTQPLLPGGSLGVDLFFALSGFLITSMLVEEWYKTGTVSLRRFYVRRFLRLFPALLAFVVVVAAIQIAFRNASFTERPGVLDTLENAALGLTYVYNWATVYQTIEGSAFGHLWTLAIEEQFYLLWPAVMVSLLKLGFSPTRLLVVAALLAALSASTPLLVADDWQRLYFGTDYRIHGLLIGSMAGILFTSGVIRPSHVRHPIVYLILALAISYVAVLMLFTTDKMVFLYRYGYPLLGVSCSIIVLACAFVERGLPLRMLGNGVITYIGRRSYAIYLWHFPMDMWFRNLNAPLQLLIAGGLTLVAAELSFRLVEGPALALRRRLEAPRMAEPAPTPTPITDALPQIAA